MVISIFAGGLFIIAGIFIFLKIDSLAGTYYEYNNKVFSEYEKRRVDASLTIVLILGGIYIILWGINLI